MVTPLKPRRSGCPIAFGLDLFGDGWSLLILRDALFEGKSTFREFVGSDEGMASNVLAERLKRLVAAGLLVREGVPEDGRQVRYRPTAAARALVPALVELAYWGASHDPATGAPAGFCAACAADRAALVAAMAARVPVSDEGG
jgi:DNA-binding HxlR family transcriptional regulator